MRPPFQKDQMFIICNRSHIPRVFNNCRRSFTHPSKSREAIINLPEQNKVSELKAFLGMLNYCHRHLSTILELLHELLRKGAKWKWQDRQKQSFRNAKMMLYSSKLLVHYDPSKSLIVSCDAFPCGIGAVISHTMPNRSEKPKAYVSRTLISAPYHPSTNGYAERAAQSFKTAMKKMEQTSSSKSLEARLQRFLLAYRTTLQSTKNNYSKAANES